MSIREQILSAIKGEAINNLIDKKTQLDEDFNNGLINYAEYEERKWIISNDIDSLYN
jgi:hypothetical protein